MADRQRQIDWQWKYNFKSYINIMYLNRYQSSCSWQKWGIAQDSKFSLRNTTFNWKYMTVGNNLGDTYSFILEEASNITQEIFSNTNTLRLSYKGFMIYTIKGFIKSSRMTSTSITLIVIINLRRFYLNNMMIA